MTIEFKPGNLIKESKLDKVEAKHFLVFLNAEVKRHEKELNKCYATAERNWRIPILAIAYHTSVIRHYEDIQFTRKTIKYLNDKFDFKQKTEKHISNKDKRDKTFK